MINVYPSGWVCISGKWVGEGKDEREKIAHVINNMIKEYN